MFDIFGNLILKYQISIQELLALGERIGNVSIGLSEDIIVANLKTRIFLSTETPSPLENVASDQDQKTVCVICQVLLLR